MENNFIQMAASAGHAVAYTIGPIFKHIIWNGLLDHSGSFLRASISSHCNDNYFVYLFHS